VTETHPPICDYEGSEYQQTFWDRGDRQYEDRVEAIALRRLLPPDGDRMLDLGAGAGRNTPRYHGFRQITLLDYSRTQLAQAQARLGRDQRYLYVAADIYRLPFAPGAFDAATMIRTLHHMAEPQAALLQVRDVLTTGAVFVLEFANKRNLKAIGRWLMRRQTWNPFDREAVEFAPLNFDFHPASVRKWLRQAGFRVGRQLSVSHFRLALLKRIVPLSVLVAMDSLAQWTGGWLQFTPSIFVRAHAADSRTIAQPDAFWRCPECRSLDLIEAESGLQCRSCARIWPIRDGIYDFKQPLESA
jgi:ubiquinone/menaquinone biosynthesis C-methylase UbiE